MNGNICTLNVRGIRNHKKRNTIYSWLTKRRCDVVFLQETFCTEEIVSDLNKGWNGTIFHSIAKSSHSCGVSTMFSEGIDFKLLNIHCDNDGRKLLLNVKIKNDTYTYVNVYAPTNEQQRITFFNELNQWIIQHAESLTNVIIGGDVNTVLNPSDRASGKTGTCANSLKEVLQVIGVSDVWKYKNPNTVCYTYIDPSDRGKHSRIDVSLASPLLLHLVKSCFYCSSTHS